MEMVEGGEVWKMELEKVDCVIVFHFNGSKDNSIDKAKDNK